MINTTKNLLADALYELLKSKSIDDIFVGEICAQCNVSRKTFYNHFQNKYELASYLYETISAKAICDLEGHKGNYFQEMGDGNSSLTHMSNDSVKIMQKLLKTWNSQTKIGRNLVISDDPDSPLNTWRKAFIAGQKKILKERLEAQGKTMLPDDLSLAAETLCFVTSYCYSDWNYRFGEDLPAEAALGLIGLLNDLMNFWVERA